tara:strand:- start:11885 stop:12220 length:336 start_codon:yes stop_codon:yes gene_type:complete
MPDYKKCVMYKIRCKDKKITDCYIGGTCNFTQRKYEHKRNCNSHHRNEYSYFVYDTIRGEGGWDKWEMIALKKFPCEDKIEKSIEENRLIDECPNATLNSRYAINKTLIKL